MTAPAFAGAFFLWKRSENDRYNNKGYKERWIDMEISDRDKEHLVSELEKLTGTRPLFY